jgi:membrane fusion protein, multidrug efflux system
MDRACRNRFGFTLSLGLALATMPTTRHLQANETDTMPPCGPRCVLVEVTLAKAQPYAPKVLLTGSIEPRFSSNIAFRISGKIEQRLVEIGDHIAADQVLARLDPQVQQANLDAAKAGLVSAQALLTQASATFDRQSELLKSGYTTRQTYDQAEQQFRTQQAAVESARAAVGTAEEQLGYAELKAGVAGIITARNAEAGQVVQAGQTVFTVAQDGPRDAVFDVYEALLTDPPSRNVRVFLLADPSVAATGTVREISPTIDPASGTVKLKVGLDSVPPQMSLGAVIVGVGTFKPHPAIVLPRSALFRWQDLPAVWLFDPKSRTVTPKIITIDRYAGEELVLSDGVASGDTVVTAGIQFLRPGQVVGVANNEPAP